MKKLIAMLLAIALLASLCGCAGTTVVVGERTCPPDAHTPVETPTEAPVEIPTPWPEDTPEGAFVKTGLAVIANVSGSAAATAEANGKADYDITVAAVTVDENGVIQSCVIDSIGTSVAFDAAGLPVDFDAAKAILTKNELGDNYGMKAYGGAAFEWYEQAAALASYAVGKTVEELRAGAVDETGHAVDADLATSATIYLEGYVSAIENAVFNAKHLGAQSGDELKLAIIPGVSSSKSADGENAGLAQLDVDAAAITMKDGIITSAQIDSVQGKVNFDATGTITGGTDGIFATKNLLGEQYGMVAWGGAIAEWDAQAASFCAYITGKTPAEVAGIAVNEGTKPVDADLATSVTIAIGGFQALVAKACN